MKKVVMFLFMLVLVNNGAMAAECTDFSGTYLSDDSVNKIEVYQSECDWVVAGGYLTFTDGTESYSLSVYHKKEAPETSGLESVDGKYKKAVTITSLSQTIFTSQTFIEQEPGKGATALYRFQILTKDSNGNLVLQLKTTNSAQQQVVRKLVFNKIK